MIIRRKKISSSQEIIMASVNTEIKQEEVIDLEVKTESVQQRVSRTAQME